MRIRAEMVDVINQNIRVISAALVLPSMIGLASIPASAGTLDDMKESAVTSCKQAKDMAYDLYDFWEAVEAGRLERSVYDQKYADFRRQKQGCLSIKEQLKQYAPSVTLPSAGDAVVFTAVRLAGIVFRNIHPSYVAAFGVGNVLEREGGNLKIHWKSIREAIANTDNLTPDEGPQNNGPFSFLHKYEKQGTETDIKNIEYLADLMQKGISESEQRNAVQKIEELKKRINNRFISHGKDPLFLFGWVGRWSVHGNVISKKKLKPIKGILEVTDGPGGAFMAWSQNSKKPMRLPIFIEGDTIRIRMNALKEPKSNNSSGSGMDFGMSKIGEMLKEVFTTLRITRQGAVCTLTVSQKNQLSKTKLNCERM